MSQKSISLEAALAHLLHVCGRGGHSTFLVNASTVFGMCGKVDPEVAGLSLLRLRDLQHLAGRAQAGSGGATTPGRCEPADRGRAPPNTAAVRQNGAPQCRTGGDR